MMIKLLQISITCVFVLMVISGVMVLIFAPDRIDVYKELVNTLFPIFTTSIIPALIGKPLTEAVKNLTEKKEQVKE